jgi:hypothetical protein
MANFITNRNAPAHNSAFPDAGEICMKENFRRERKVFSKRVRTGWLAAACAAFAACGGGPGKNVRPVEFVERGAVFTFDKRADPLLLVVEVREGGRLSLNRIETGTLDDPGVLCEKLAAVFEDREKAGIFEKEVIVEPRGNAGRKELEKLLEELSRARAAPIRVIKNGL